MVPSLLFGFLGQYPGEGLPDVVVRVSVAPHQEHLYSIVLIVSAIFLFLSAILFFVFLFQLLALGVHLLKSVNSFLFGVFEVLTH